MSRPITGQRVTRPKVQISDAAYRRVTAASKRTGRTVRDIASAIVEEKLDIAIVPLCGICANRDATVADVIDGKRMFLCGKCANEPVPDPEVTERNETDRRRKRLLTAIRWNPGATFGELRDVLDIPSTLEDVNAYDVYMSALVRMVRDGVVRRTGEKLDYRYWLVGAK